jgi:hypothetical protein
MGREKQGDKGDEMKEGAHFNSPEGQQPCNGAACHLFTGAGRTGVASYARRVRRRTLRAAKNLG